MLQAHLLPLIQESMLLQGLGIHHQNFPPPDSPVIYPIKTILTTMMLAAVAVVTPAVGVATAVEMITMTMIVGVEDSVAVATRTIGKATTMAVLMVAEMVATKSVAPTKTVTTTLVEAAAQVGVVAAAGRALLSVFA
jgi:hypothetical protein